MKKLQSLGKIAAVFSLAMTATSVAKPAKAVIEVINFDSFTVGQTIPGNTFISQGVTFDQNLVIFNSAGGALPSSAPNAAANADTIGGSLSGFFTETVNSISVFAGDNGSDTETVTLVGLDDSDNILASDTFTGLSAQLLSISSPGITNFEINQTGLIAIDDFSFDTSSTSASVPFEFSPTLGLLLIGGVFGISRYAKSRKAAKLINDR